MLMKISSQNKYSVIIQVLGKMSPFFGVILTRYGMVIAIRYP